MELNKPLSVTEQLSTQPVASPKNDLVKNAPTQKQNHHNSASYAARLWHSSVKHAHPQKHTGIEL